jgi:hypothetical protein
VSVSDGQLNFRLADLGGSDWWAMINGLEVVAVGGQIQAVASIADSQFDAAIAQYHRGMFNRKPAVAAISRAAVPLADNRDLDLLHEVVARSPLRQREEHSKVRAAHDEALASLFDDLEFLNPRTLSGGFSRLCS